MRFLLDTHIWLWNVAGSSRITSRVRESLDDAGNELWLSPISVWEALLLAERGRVVLQPDGQTWVRTQLDRAILREASLTYEVARESRAVRMDHEDPADRFLAATARVFDLTLVTADRRLARVKGLNVLRNR